MDVLHPPYLYEAAVGFLTVCRVLLSAEELHRFWGAESLSYVLCISVIHYLSLASH